MPDRTEYYALGAALGVTGVGLLILTLTGRAGAGRGCSQDAYGSIACLQSGEQMSRITVADFDALTSPTPIKIGDMIPCVNPVVSYAGPGRDAHAYFRIVQQQNGIWVTVQASGVSGTHLFPSPTLVSAPLVPSSQIQPAGCTPNTLCAYVWPGPDCPGTCPAPICGASPQPGLATLLVEVYEHRTPADADGYASPTCTGRLPVQRTPWPNMVMYT